MAYAFEGFATAEFKGGTYSCAGGLPSDVIGYLPSFLPNTTTLQAGGRAGRGRAAGRVAARERRAGASMTGRGACPRPAPYTQPRTQPPLRAGGTHHEPPPTPQCARPLTSPPQSPLVTSALRNPGPGCIVSLSAPLWGGGMLCAAAARAD
jgi:hypothetical protein